MNALTAAAKAMINQTNGPTGVVIGLHSDGSDQLTAVGTRDGDTAAMTPETVHDLASVTKIVATTTSLIRLVSDGSVRLDDGVGHYVPEFRGGAKDVVTIADLLSHRGGLWEWQPLYLRTSQPREASRYAARLDLRYRPGSRRAYSDLGFMLLGRVIEVACSQNLDEAVAELVTTPLGLGRTGFGTNDSNVSTSARGDDTERRMIATGQPYPVPSPAEFDSWRTTAITAQVNDGNAFHALGGVSGHAGLFGPATDLLRYAAAMARYRDHDALWRPEIVDTFLTPSLDHEQALGFRRYRFDIGHRTTTMYGHPGFVGCVVGFDPHHRLGLVLATNRLLTTATPMANDELWSLVRRTAGGIPHQQPIARVTP